MEYPMQVPWDKYEALFDLFLQARSFMKDRPRQKRWDWRKLREAVVKTEAFYPSLEIPPAREEPQIPGSGHHPDRP